jgi:hypothetical protein
VLGLVSEHACAALQWGIDKDFANETKVRPGSLKRRQGSKGEGATRRARSDHTKRHKATQTIHPTYAPGPTPALAPGAVHCVMHHVTLRWGGRGFGAECDHV